jgi:hypothetical protein
MASAPPGGGPVAALKREHKKAFENTATAAGTILLPEPPGPYTVTDTEEITVECPTPPGPTPGQQQPGGGAAPITQESEQESEAGEIDQSFEVS